MRVKNATDGPRFVPLLDTVVEPGEEVDVPDFQADGVSPIVWPEETWEPVTDKAAAVEDVPLPEDASTETEA